jgi:hypothetical protein
MLDPSELLLSRVLSHLKEDKPDSIASAALHIKSLGASLSHLEYLVAEFSTLDTPSARHLAFIAEAIKHNMQVI